MRVNYGVYVAVGDSMAVYSKKYGRYFNSRRELGQFDCQQRRCSPILPWFGLRDSNLDPEWKKEHRPDQEGSPWIWAFLWAVVIVSLLTMCSK